MAITYKKQVLSGVTTTPVTLYNPTATNVQATIIGFIICNKTSSNITATVTLTTGGATVNIIYNTIIVAGTSLNVVDASRIILTQNDLIAVSTSGLSDVTLAVIEVV
jgi:hypothetical protein